MVELTSTNDSYAFGATEYMGVEIQRGLGALLEDIGFQSVENDAIAGRTEPSVNDVMLTLKNMGNKLSEVSDYVRQVKFPNKRVLDDPIVSREVVISSEVIPEVVKTIDEAVEAPLEEMAEMTEVVVKAEAKAKSKFFTAFSSDKVVDMGFAIQPKVVPKPIEVEKKVVQPEIKIKTMPVIEPIRYTPKISIAPISKPKKEETPKITNINAGANANSNNVGGMTADQMQMIFQKLAEHTAISKIQQELASRMLTNSLFPGSSNNPELLQAALQLYQNGNATSMINNLASSINNVSTPQPLPPKKEKKKKEPTADKKKARVSDEHMKATFESVLEKANSAVSIKPTPPPRPIPSSIIPKSTSTTNLMNFKNMKYEQPQPYQPQQLDIPVFIRRNESSTSAANVPVVESTPKVVPSLKIDKSKMINQTPILPPLLPPLVESEKEMARRLKREKKERKEKKRLEKEKKKALAGSGNTTALSDISSGGNSTLPSLSTSLFQSNSSVTRPLSLDTRPETVNRGVVTSIISPAANPLKLKIKFGGGATNSPQVTSPISPVIVKRQFSPVVDDLPSTSRLTFTTPKKEISSSLVQKTVTPIKINLSKMKEKAETSERKDKSLKRDKKKEKKDRKSGKHEKQEASFDTTLTTTPRPERSKKSKKDAKEEVGEKAVTAQAPSFSSGAGQDYLKQLQKNRLLIKDLSPIQLRPITPVIKPTSLQDVEEEERGKSSIKTILNSFSLPSKKDKEREKGKRSKDSSAPLLNEPPRNVLPEEADEFSPLSPILGGDTESIVWICPKCNVAYNEDAEMVCCDDCENWFHFHCVELSTAPKESERWVCVSCTKKTKGSSKRKRKSGGKDDSKPSKKVRTG
uniref:PHD-type domain-containing protein n=1 Tax=Rhabditophanes sp. KR3021 TaxID=114890 RepID=A0AC35TIT9_9BILA